MIYFTHVLLKYNAKNNPVNRLHLLEDEKKETKERNVAFIFPLVFLQRAVTSQERGGASSLTV